MKVKFLIELKDLFLSGEATNLAAGLAKLEIHPYVPSFFFTHFLVLTLGKPFDLNFEGFSNSFLFSSTFDDISVVVLSKFFTVQLLTNNEFSTDRAGLASGEITKPDIFSDLAVHLADGGKAGEVDTDGGGAVSVHLYPLSAAVAMEAARAVSAAGGTARVAVAGAAEASGAAGVAEVLEEVSLLGSTRLLAPLSPINDGLCFLGGV